MGPAGHPPATRLLWLAPAVPGRPRPALPLPATAQAATTTPCASPAPLFLPPTPRLSLFPPHTVRSPAKYPAGTWPPGTAVVAGDVTQPATLPAALAGADAAVFAASAAKGTLPATVDDEGVGHLATAAKAAGLRSVVLVSSALVDPKNGWNWIRILLNNMRKGKMMDAKWAGERRLVRTGVPYTIVRPGGLTDGPGGVSALVVAQGDTGSPGRVARADVGRVCVAAAFDPAATGVTLELASDAKKLAAEGPALVGLFDRLAKD